MRHGVPYVQSQGLWAHSEQVSRYYQLQGTLWLFPRTSLVHEPLGEMILFQSLNVLQPQARIEKHQWVGKAPGAYQIGQGS